MVNNKVRDLKFYYVVTANITAILVNFLRDWPNSFNIAQNELKLSIWIKDGKVYIPTKFQENLKNLKFLCNLCIILSIPSYGCKNDQSMSN